MVKSSDKIMICWQFVLPLFLVVQVFSADALRNKRSSIVGSAPTPLLVYPFGGTLKLLMGCAIPIAMPGRILVYGQNLQFQFPLPQNASSFNELVASRSSRSSRSRRQISLLDERSLFYQYLQHQLERHGIPGKDCIKRSICETAESSLIDDGLVGEIFHVLFTPDYGESLGAEEEYKEAARLGRMGQDCFKAYPLCPKGFGILDHISKIFEHDA